jgi:hypothetical protein
VINRIKKERRQSSTANRPAVRALERATPVPLHEVPESPTFQVPDPPPAPPPAAQWIRYQVDVDDFDRVAASVGSNTPADVGRATFDWYLAEQVD